MSPGGDCERSRGLGWGQGPCAGCWGTGLGAGFGDGAVSGDLLLAASLSPILFVLWERRGSPGLQAPGTPNPSCVYCALLAHAESLLHGPARGLPHHITPFSRDSQAQRDEITCATLQN